MGSTANTCSDRRRDTVQTHIGSHVRVIPRGEPGRPQHPVARFPTFLPSPPPTRHLRKSCSLISTVLQSCRTALLTLGRGSRDSGSSLSDEPMLEKPHSSREFARRPNPRSFAIGGVEWLVGDCYMVNKPFHANGSSQINIDVKGTIGVGVCISLACTILDDR